jgi:uncharacterized protein
MAAGVIVLLKLRLTTAIFMKRRLKTFHDRFISLKGEPQSIAMGLAMGVFIGVTPTIPFHTALIILIGLVWKHNLTSAYLGSWLISNPLTIPIFYFGQYELGRFLLGSPGVQLNITDYSLQSLLALGWHIVLPLLIGGLIMAPIFAIPAYFIGYRAIISLRENRQK